jgi:aryl-alcohol dehydrogenase-like predicted oxidoreductase
MTAETGLQHYLCSRRSRAPAVAGATVVYWQYVCITGNKTEEKEQESISMQLCTLGATSIQVSRIGLGLAALGRPGYINLGHADDLNQTYDVAAMESRTHTVLDAARDAGVRYFDAARSYGRAEEFLGNWLRARRLSPGVVTVGSKWGYTYTANWQVQADVHEVKEHSLDVLQRQWQESTTHLGDNLHLYQIHSATLESGVLENQDVLEALARLKQTGMLIGLTVSGEQQAATIQRAIAVTIDGARLFDSVQATWNLLEPSTAPVLREARAAGMGVLIKEALANGRLTQRNTRPDDDPLRAVLERHAARLNTTPDALALAGVLAQPWVDVALSGAATIEHLQSNLQALQVAWDEEAAADFARIAEPPEHYWSIRKALAWN